MSRCLNIYMQIVLIVMFILKGRRLKVHNLTTAAHEKIPYLRSDLSVGNIGPSVQVNIMRKIMNNVKFIY